ncbi:MAG: Asp-tRNA(Asn)/Glu-tRNA(Gln) amidotransferase subunit GatC [Phycisphaerales bacterium]|nr:Asp-tRNA(Asn)/Glu-tRNA(Gln) amidotransferase subunit GatC [Phycisphaerales bacterium]
MPDEHDQKPTIAEIARVAHLSRLALDEATLTALRGDLLQILGHVEAISSLDVEGVEPMSRPHPTVNRLDPDIPGPALDRSVLLALAPAVEGPFLAVPKVLAEGGG